MAAAGATHGERLLPVLAARDDAVEGARDAAFPEMSSFRMGANDPAGWAAGVAAADLASLSPHEPIEAERASA